MFVGKTGAYLSEPPFSCSTLGLDTGLTLKHWTMLERHAMNKHISLLRKAANYGRKKFYNIIGPWCQAKLSNDLFLNGKNSKFLN